MFKKQLIFEMESVLSCLVYFSFKKWVCTCCTSRCLPVTLGILCAVLRLTADQIDYLFYGTLNSNTVWSASQTVIF